jgi:prepilin-type N-terminal cleavage/methylation domain-containing protein
MKMPRAFTLVEILIVVVVLGILAAIVIPTVADSTTAAKESALTHDLHMLRRYILVYTSQHLEVSPGYPDGATDQTPTEQAFVEQITMASNTRGQTAATGTPGYNRGPYLLKIPINPFNKKTTVEVLDDGDSFPAAADDSHGWIYKPLTSEVRADNTGTDASGKAYYDF